MGFQIPNTFISISKKLLSLRIVNLRQLNKSIIFFKSQGSKDIQNSEIRPQN